MKSLFSLSNTKSFVSSLFLSVALGVAACGGNAECGDGTTQAGEACDDGNTQDGDGCSSECEEEVQGECGDGIVEGGEECDDGDSVNGDGCSADCDIEELSEAQQINQYVQGLDSVPAEPEGEVVNSTSDPEVTADGNYSCSSVNLTQVAPLNEVSILSAVTSSLFPGDILFGDSLYNGTFASSGIDRRPMTYSLSIQDGTAAQRSATMQNPSLSEFRDTIGGILAQANLGNVPVSADAKVTEVRSQKDLDIALGVDVNTLTTDVKSQFDFTSQNIQSQFLVSVDMAFFTADLDANLRPSDFFADSVTLGEVEQEFDDANPPVYVSSITYGTRYYVAVSSSFSSEEVNAALDVAFNNGTTQVDGSLTVSTSEILQNTSLRAISVGAQPEQLAAFNAILSGDDRLASIKSFLSDGDNFSAANIGVPLSFIMKNMTDNSVAALAVANTTDVQVCERISQNLQVTLKSISLVNGSDAFNNDLEIAGSIIAQGLTSATLFSQSASQAVVVPDGGSLPFNGAQFQKIVRIDPRNPNTNVKLTADFIEVDSNNNDDLPAASVTINKNSTGSDAGGTFVGKGFSGQYTLKVFSTSGDLTIVFSLQTIP